VFFDMRPLLSLFLGLTISIASVAPVFATVVDRDTRDDLGSTQGLNERVLPLLDVIRSATDKLVDGSLGPIDWQAIQDAASKGLDETMTTEVRECSKDYWAMTYATFGLFYLASTRAIDMGDAEQARAELDTAVTTTSLSEVAYQRALRDCGPRRYAAMRSMRPSVIDVRLLRALEHLV
jgi:hypothetical protein